MLGQPRKYRCYKKNGPGKFHSNGRTSEVGRSTFMVLGTIKNVAIWSLYFDLRTLYQTPEHVGKMLILPLKGSISHLRVIGY